MCVVNCHYGSVDLIGRELKWERDMSSLAGQVGTVQFDDPEYGITAET